jgi:hypothetical protein
VVAATGTVAIFELYDLHPFSLPDEFPEGLPPFKPPSFSVSDGNITMTASDIFEVYPRPFWGCLSLGDRQFVF